LIAGDFSAALSNLGISQTKNLYVWPAGLTPVSWDGEGRAEWLSSEKIFIGIRPDHASESIEVDLVGVEGDAIRIQNPRPGAPIFVELPQLSIGVHKVRVNANLAGMSDQVGSLEIAIREPRIWQPGTADQGAFRVTVDPPSPTLEQLWEGRVALEIQGPPDRVVIPTVSLFGGRRTESRVERRLPPLPLPADAKAWRTHFERFFQRREDAQNLYDAASACTISLDAEELGHFGIRCEREFSPLRWVVQRHIHGYELVVLDDSGAEDHPQITRFEFDTPDEERQVAICPLTEPMQVPLSGGMYLAHSGIHNRAVIIPPRAGQTRKLDDLRVDAQLREYQRTSIDIRRLLDFIEIWSSARRTGFLSETKCKFVVNSMLRKVFSIIGGQWWAVAEQRFSDDDSPRAIERLSRAAAAGPPASEIAQLLARDVSRFSSLESKERAFEFSMVVALHLRALGRISQARWEPVRNWVRRPSETEPMEWICEFALRLASAPESLQRWQAERVETGIDCLMELPFLARLARVLVLAVDRFSNGGSGAGDSFLYRRWGWE